MNDLILIRPHCREKSKTERLSAVLNNGLGGYKWDTITTIEEFENADLRGKKLLFAISLGESGINLEFYSIIKRIRLRKSCFEGSVAGAIIDGNSELFTKSVARELVFSANMAGCTFPGRPLVEGTCSLENYNIIAKNLETDNIGAYLESGKNLIRRIVEFDPSRPEKPNLLVLHASDYTTSNSLGLWQMVKEHLDSWEIKEISIRDGQVWDCIGCHYDTCLHFGEQGQCVYGGVIVEQVYPAILNCNALLLICPNYNDAVGANIAAFINRLTALFRAHSFFDKRLFGIIVSGYSGGDIVAQQLISALNMNKTFILPSRFAMIETANNPGSIHEIDSIAKRAFVFAENMMTAF